MRILGIDPGSQITGYGIVEKIGPRLLHVDNGGIFTRGQESFSSKLKTIFQGVEELIERYAPQAVAIESIFYGKNIRSSFQLGHARGVAMVAAANRDLSVFEYTPLSVKQALVGYGRASKEQIQQMVKHLLKLPETTYFDASDALAVAICHLNSLKFTEKVRAAGGAS
ncbi:MAG: crossover junction endodeoxyribonuclease RuvC [bacterium]